VRPANGYSYNTIASIAPMTIFEIALSSLEEAIKQAPGLSVILIELLSRQRALLIEHLTNIGCRSALVRTAYVLLELSDRVRACGIGDPDSFYCPLTQYQLADASGLTPIHLSRILRELREEELPTVTSSRADILDRDRLVAISDYAGEFLRMSVVDRN